MKIKKPIRIDYENDTTDEIINKIAFSIEQHSSFPRSLILIFYYSNIFNMKL